MVVSIRGTGINLVNTRARSPASFSSLKTRFIVNLRSGHAAQSLEAVRSFAARHGAAVVLTERVRHAHEIAARALAEECALIVAVGGDGTMNEVASALIGTGATLGLVPCGSGDGLGRHLRLHGSVARALEILLTGQSRPIDTGLADGHPFVTAAGIGFEAEIARRFNQLERRGFLRYLTTSAQAYFGWQSEDYTVVHGTACDRFHAFTLAVTNANQYGNNARITPDARVDDGLLDLCAVPPISFLNALPLAAHLFRGTIGRVRGISLRRSAGFVVERATAGPLHTDGEVHAAGTRIEFAIRPASLRVMCPR